MTHPEDGKGQLGRHMAHPTDVYFDKGTKSRNFSSIFPLLEMLANYAEAQACVMDGKRGSHSGDAQDVAERLQQRHHLVGHRRQPHRAHAQRHPGHQQRAPAPGDT